MKRSKFYALSILIFSIIFLVSTGTEAKDKKQDETKKEEKKDSKKNEEMSQDDRDELNYGYAIMYQHIEDLSGSKVLLAVKKNSEQLSKLVDEIVQVLEEDKKILDDLKKKYPAINFENRGQPEIIEQTIKSIKWHKAFTFMPLVGKSGDDFERDFVIDTKYGIDQIVRISHFISEREKNPGLKEPLQKISDRTKKLLDDIEYLLNERYYKVNLNKKK